MATPAQLELRRLAAEAADLMEVTPLEATRLALESYLCKARRDSSREGRSAPLCIEEVQAAVTVLEARLGTFTNNDLLDEIFGEEEVIIEPHSVKIEIGHIMRGLGFELKQIRRRRYGRILAWRKQSRPKPLNLETHPLT